MILSKIEFADAKYQVLNRLVSDTQPLNIALTIYSDSVLSFEIPGNQTSGLSFQYYDVKPWKFTLKYDDIYSILDQFRHLQTMDQTGILWKYMLYVQYNNNVYSLFVNMTSVKQDLIKNTISFEAYTMLGIILLYGNQKPIMEQDVQVQNIDQNDLIIPRQLRIKTVLEPWTFLFPNQINSIGWVRLSNADIMRKFLTTVYGTAVLNIFTRNNEYEQYNQYWNVWYIDPYDKNHQKYFADYDKLVIMYHMATYNSEYYNQIPTGEYSALLEDYIGWNAYLNNKINEANLSYTIQELQLENGRFDNIVLSYGERSCIDFIPNVNGLTFSQLINNLTNAGYFTEQPYILEQSTDPGDIGANQPVIGIYAERPNWLDSSHQYYYRNPSNDELKRLLQISYTKYAVTKLLVPNNPNIRKHKLYKRTVRYIVDMYTPNSIGSIIDTGWQIINLTQNIENGILEDIWIPYVFDSIGNYDDFYLPFLEYINSGKQKYTVVLANIINSIALNYSNQGVVNYNCPANISYINFKKPSDDTDTTIINNIQLLKQIMQLLNISFIWDINNGRSIYTQKFVSAGFPSDVEDYYIIDSDQVANYKYVYYIKEKPKNIYSFNVIEQDPLYNRIVRSFYGKLQSNINKKIVINVINDITELVNVTTNRWFIFDNHRFICTSILYDNTNNITQIEGFGR